jgi:hypothetical protein
MADVADMLLQQGFKNASEVPDVAGAMTKGAQLAESINQIQLSRAQFEQQKQQQYVAKIEKFSSLYETAAKLPPGSARNNLYKTVIPKTRDALGLQAEFPDDSLQMINSAPEVIGYLKAKVEAGDMTLPQLLQSMQDPQWIADNIPAALQEKAGQDLTPQVTDSMESLQAAESTRIQQAATKENARIMAQNREQAAIAADERAPDVDLRKKVNADYRTWTTGGGSAAYNSYRDILKRSIKKLENNEVVLGTKGKKIGSTLASDETSLAWLDEDAKVLLDDIRGGVSIKEKTGDPNPTEMQVNRILGQIIDPKLSNKANISKMKDALKKSEMDEKTKLNEFSKYIPGVKAAPKKSFQDLSATAQKEVVAATMQRTGKSEAEVRKMLGAQ